MKSFTTVLAAAFIAGSATLAMAQGSGGGAAGSDVNPDRLGKGADQNPSSAGAAPQAGTKEATTPGQATTGTTGSSMTTAPVSGTAQGQGMTPSKDSSTPAQAPTTKK